MRRTASPPTKTAPLARTFGAAALVLASLMLAACGGDPPHDRAPSETSGLAGAALGVISARRASSSPPTEAAAWNAGTGGADEVAPSPVQGADEGSPVSSTAESNGVEPVEPEPDAIGSQEEPADAAEGPTAGPWTVELELASAPFDTESAPSVVVHAPPAFDPARPLRLVVFLHGWNGCARLLMRTGPTSCRDGDPSREGWALARRFDEAGTDALFVIPQLALLRRDGSPGRFLQDGRFRAFLREMLTALHLDAAADRIESVTLLAHSAGFEGALALLAHGGIDIDHVVLFDALYRGIQPFTSWAAEAPSRRLVSLYTGGRTERQSRLLARHARRFLERESIASDPPESRRRRARSSPRRRPLAGPSRGCPGATPRRPPSGARPFGPAAGTILAVSSGMDIVVVTGMSGAGRTSALHVLEDLGYFCVDNLPPQLAPQLVEMVEGELKRVGFGMDVRTGAFLVGAADILDALAQKGHQTEVIFLDCADEVLVRRFSETRRPHPLAEGADVLAGIRAERERLSALRTRARHVIDTSRTSVHDLRRSLIDYMARGGTRPRMAVRVVSFGFKYGLPVDADLVFDLRFLPNPHFVPELRPLTGREPEVAAYVLEADATKELIADLQELLGHALPRYEREGKAYLTIAVGCTGGRHQSVAVAEHLATWLRQTGHDAVVAHRDAER